MKKFQKITALSYASVLIFSFGIAYAQDNVQSNYYVPLAPLPETTHCGSDYIAPRTVNGVYIPASCNYATDLQTYLPGIIRWSIGVAAALAFVMITAGGIWYATSDAITGKSEARKIIENAIYGLVLVISAWVILNTINPDILHIKLKIPRPPIENSTTESTIPTLNAGGNIAGVPMTPDQIAASNAVIRGTPNSLNTTSVGPQITPYNGPCTNGQTVGCVNLNGMQQSTVSGLQNLRNTCNCDISITGGTEAGHTTDSCHNIGTCADIKASTAINNKIITGSKSTTPSGCTLYTYLGGKYILEGTGNTCGGSVASTGDHWHVTF